MAAVSVSVFSANETQRYKQREGRDGKRQMEADGSETLTAN